MSVLIIAEHDHNTLHLSTIAAINAASQLTKQITVLVMGFNCNTVATLVATTQFVTKVLYLDHINYKHLLAENIVPVIIKIISKNLNYYKYILCSATAFGKNILPRVAACLDVEQISEVTKIVSSDTFERFIYSGNAIQIVKLFCDIKCLTIRMRYFIDQFVNAKNTNIAIIDQLDPANFIANTVLENRVKFLEFIKSNQQLELTTAKIVVAGGRGLQNKDNFILIGELANKLNAAIGATRTAVNAGFIANDAQIGFSGKTIAPDLYIAIGISGAVQHISGIKDSKVIVAINMDENAPIFQFANYKIVGDLFKVVPELIAQL